MRLHRNKIMAVLLIFVMVLSIIGSTGVEAKKTTQYGVVTASELYMRSGPGTTYDRIEVSGEGVILKKDQQVKILGEEDGWYKIRLEYNGETITGYSLGKYISKIDSSEVISATPTPTVAPTPTPVPEIVISGVITASELYMREGPGTTYSQVKTGDEKVILKRNTEVSILGELDGWYLLRVNIDGQEITGYSLGTYVKKTGDGEVPMVTFSPTKAPTPSAATPAPTSSPVPTNEIEVTATPEPTGTESSFTEPVEYEGHTIAQFLKEGEKVTSKYKTVTAELSVKYNLLAQITASDVEIRKTSTLASTVMAKLPKGTEVIVTGMTVNSIKIDGKTTKVRWYRIATVIDGEAVKGYCLSDSIKISDSYTATTKYAKQIIRAKASTTSDAVTISGGKQVKLAKGTEVKIIGETTKNGTKWLKVEVTYKKETVKGYILALRLSPVSNASKITVKYPVIKAKYASTPTPEPTTSEVSPTAVPTGDVEPTDIVDPTSIPTDAPTGSAEEPTPTPTPVVYEFEGGNAVIVDAPSLCVKTEAKYSATALYTDDKKVVMLYSDQPVEVLSAQSVDGIDWCYIRLAFAGKEYFGYINANYVKADGELDILGNTDGKKTNDMDFETKLALQGFPESYKPYLLALHEKYPNWEFEAYHTGLDWNETIKAESEAGINLIPNTKSVEWKSLDAGAYSWKTDTFTVFDGSTWVTASKAAIEYYMDPRNFLSENTIFMFEKLTYNPEYQTKTGITTILKNTAMNGTGYLYTDENGVERSITYADSFLMAAEYSGVSPLHLASRVKQEVSLGATAMSNSVTGTVPGYEGLYNFYNIGANNSTVSGGAIANGLNYARNGSSSATLNLKCLFPWNNRLRSILGGAYYIGNNYINRGQDTIYLQKFNVTSNNTYNHQYMGNVEAPYSEGKRLLSAYENPSELAVVFSIPVYENMPLVACAVPEKQYNPNNWLSALKLYDNNGNKLITTPTFSITSSSEYSIIVDYSVDYIKIKATTVSSTANVISNNYFYPEVGSNRLVISVQAENGDVRDYVINIVREEPQVTPEPTPTELPDITDTPAVTPEVTEAPTEAPAVTAEVTEAPTVTPEVTETPTEAPAVTPEVTEAPTEAPAVTSGVTEAPADAPADTPT